MIPITHSPGRHCASTALSDVMRFHGAPLSEAMCFGLGEGLGLYYVGLPGMNPSRLLAVRSLPFEEKFFTRLGLNFVWDQHPEPAAAEAALFSALDAGRPALVQTDIYYLPYYQSKTHFAGHLIAVWGYDKEKGVVYVTDTERPNVLEVPIDALRRARYCKLPPFVMEGNLFAPENLAVPADLGARAWEAVQANSRAILNEELFYSGMPALRAWRDELAAWPALHDWKWTARFAYQTILKRGTGGGGFRLMYADFLREVEPLVPRVRELGLAADMQVLGEAWDRLALALRDLSDQETPDVTRVAPALAEVADREESYHRKVVSAV
jgi:hypothetical protein